MIGAHVLRTIFIRLEVLGCVIRIKHIFVATGFSIRPSTTAKQGAPLAHCWICVTAFHYAC